MKKTLCLILALVFVLGLCTVGAGAAEFSDKADIQYTAAVNAMQNLGILQGSDDDADGVYDFKPADSVTREQAAKLIAYMVLGKETADKMPARAIFSDVAADRWSAGYINYCYTKGIINGLGNGKFDPEAPVTGTQLFKMLLCALGYGKNGEFVGAGWDINVFTEAVILNLIESSKAADFDAAATREEAALYVWNTMGKQVQNYDAKSESYSDANKTFKANVWKVTAVAGILTDNNSNNSTLLPNTSIINGTTVSVATTEAQLGHYISLEWNNNAKAPVIYSMTDASTECGLAGLPTTISDYKFGAAYVKFDSTVVYGKTKSGLAEAYVFDNGSYTGTFGKSEASASDLKGTFVVYGGKIVAYKDSKYAYGNLSITTDSITKKTIYTVSGVEVVGAENMKKGDFVSVQQVGNIYHVYPLTVEENVKIVKKTTSPLESYNDTLVRTAIALPVGVTLPTGVTYAAADTILVGSSYDIYKDHMGKVVGVKTHVDPADYAAYAYVLDIKDAGADTYGQPGVGSYARCIDVNGNVQYYHLFSSATAELKKLEKQVVLVGVDAVNKGFSTIALDSAKTGAEAYAKKATFKIAEGANIIKVDTTEGLKISLLSSITEKTNILYTYSEAVDGSAKVKTAQTIWVTGAVADAEVENSYIYVGAFNTAAAEQTYSVETGNAYFYNVYVDGVMTKIQNKDNKALTAGFNKYTVSGNDVYTLTSVDTATKFVFNKTTNDDKFNITSAGVLNYEIDSAMYEINLANVTIVDLVNVASPITTVEGLAAAMAATKLSGATVNFTGVLAKNTTAKTASFVGNVIYIVAG